MENNAYKKIILDIIIKHMPNVRVILFGSRARKDAQPGSDIDIAIDGGKKIDTKKMNQLRIELEDSSLPIHFDIVDIHNVSDHMKRQILKDRITWKN